MDENNRLLRTIRKVELMEKQHVWPASDERNLWTDAHGIVLYSSIYHHTEEKKWLDRAEALVRQVKAELGKRVGFRFSNDSKGDAQYFHYLMKLAFALHILGRYIPQYAKEAIQLCKSIHPFFFVKEKGFYWKMQEDLSAPYPFQGMSDIDLFEGYAVYRILDNSESSHPLQPEIAEVKQVVDRCTFAEKQDFQLGEALWLSHFFPNEDWAQQMKAKCLEQLDAMWVQDGNYFCRRVGHPSGKWNVANFVISIGLQGWGEWIDRVDALNESFETYKGGEHKDAEIKSHVMDCCSLFPGYFLSNFAVHDEEQKEQH